MKLDSPFARRLTPLLIPATLLAIAAFSAFTKKDESDYYYKVNKGLEVFGQIYREVAQSYVDQVDPETFINAGIDGMLKTLDPYSVYLRRKDAADIDLLTSGTYGGIGITVGTRDSAVTIVDVVDGYSAQREGIRIGDKILSINGVELLHSPVENLREHTRGEAGTTLRLSVLRDGVAEPISVTLTRENIRLHSVSYSGSIGEGIGYIKLDRFSSSAGDELQSALLELKQSGSYKGLVLDLRDNPGGLLESAVDVTSKFVPNGSVVVTTHGRDSSEDHIYRSTEDPIAGGVPLVVLVNSGSASASEIVAGAIQDLDAGVIMGTRSFGKGLVQSVHRLPYESSLKITTARYYTPSGRSIQKIDYLMQRSGASSFLVDTASRFRSSHGRALLDHGGIIPDTTVDADSLPSIVGGLRDGSLFFKFATRYAAGMKKLPAGFTVDNALLKQFEDFAFTSLAASPIPGSALAKAGDLYTSARSEGYDQNTLRKIEELKNNLQSGERVLFTKFQDGVRRELHVEIVNRFRTQRERTTALLSDDDQVLSAVNLLRTGHHEYGRLLSTR